MEIEGLVTKVHDYDDRSSWHLTSKGLTSLESVASLRLGKPLFKCNRTDTEFESWNVFELWYHMRESGWSTEIAPLAAQIRELSGFE